MFAAEIKKRRVGGMKSSHWRWHLDEMFVKINGEICYLWPKIDREWEASTDPVGCRSRLGRVAFNQALCKLYQ
jgi:hypothetical protein